MTQNTKLRAEYQRLIKRGVVIRGCDQAITNGKQSKCPLLRRCCRINTFEDELPCEISDEELGIDRYDTVGKDGWIHHTAHELRHYDDPLTDNSDWGLLALPQDKRRAKERALRKR